MTVLTFAPALSLPGEPAPDDFAIMVSGRAVALVSDQRFTWRLPSLGDLLGVTVLEPLGRLNGRSVWLAAADRPSTSYGLAEVAWLDVLSAAPAAVASAAARALQLREWRETHHYCGACGGPTGHAPGMLADRCTACGRLEYVKAQPVALVAIWRPAASGAAEVLLARHTYGSTHLWALIGGYLDPAESLEDAAIREAAEEVGLAVTDLRYYGSEGWGIPGPSIMAAAFIARVADPTRQPVVDGQEIAEARFYPVDQLPTPTPPQPLIAARLLADLPRLLA